MLDNIFQGLSKEFLRGVDAINILNLNSLLFRSGEAVDYKSLYFPGDLALFGHVSPAATSFSVSPLSPLVIAGADQQFTTVPQVSGLIWSIATVGDNSPTGTIDSQSGLYTAPSAADINGQMVRVRVTATTADQRYKNSGLISVVKSSMSVNPLIQEITAGSEQGLTLTAGSVSGNPETYKWAFEDPSSPAQLTAFPDGTCTYLPGPPIDKQYYRVDTVVVTSGEEHVSCAVLVVNGNQGLVISIDAESVQVDGMLQTVKLVVLGEDNKPLPDLEWALLTGSGSIDKLTGVFTVDPTGTYRYAVITTVYSHPVMTLRGCMILPLPLLAMEHALNVLTV